MSKVIKWMAESEDALEWFSYLFPMIALGVFVYLVLS